MGFVPEKVEKAILLSTEEAQDGVCKIPMLEGRDQGSQRESDLP